MNKHISLEHSTPSNRMRFKGIGNQILQKGKSSTEKLEKLFFMVSASHSIHSTASPEPSKPLSETSIILPPKIDSELQSLLEDIYTIVDKILIGQKPKRAFNKNYKPNSLPQTSQPPEPATKKAIPEKLQLPPGVSKLGNRRATNNVQPKKLKLLGGAVNLFSGRPTNNAPLANEELKPLTQPLTNYALPKLFIGRTSKLSSDYSQLTSQLKKKIEEYYIFWNTHAKLCGTPSILVREKLQQLTNYLSKPSEDFYKHKTFLLKAFKTLSTHLIIPKKNPTITSLKPSQTFGCRLHFKPAVQQAEVLSEQHLQLKLWVLDFLHSASLSTLPPHLHLIFEYLKGNNSLEQLPLETSNARSFLEGVKIIDIACAEYNRNNPEKLKLARSSFELRTCILEISSPLMTTAEAYTITPNPRKYTESVYLSNPMHWVPERIRHHLVIMSNQMVQALALSTSLQHVKPCIVLTRGNTASGKSTTLSQYARLDSPDRDLQHSNITPDNAKKQLRNPLAAINAPLLNIQVHDEGKALHNRFLSSLAGELKTSSFFVEGRYSSIEDVEAILATADAKGAEVRLTDLETSLTTSLFRVLERDPYSDQCPPAQEIVKGYKASIQYLKQLLAIIKKKPAVTEFKLFYDDEFGLKQLVVEKKKQAFTIHSQELLDKCCQLPSDRQIQQILDTPISPKQLEELNSQGLLQSTTKSLLDAWDGVPLGYAVDMHALGTSPGQARTLHHIECIWRKSFGQVERQPFDGLWLADMPSLLKHIRSELLDIRGVDKEGKGLHFFTGKFDWKLNPAYNPETPAIEGGKPGFQMRVGYFIIPLSKAKTYTNKHLSPAVLKELEVRDDNGELIGYRLFVHPEAYAHYKALHASNLPFIQGKDSEFMGTPTSSYRSWLLRRIDKDQKVKTVPFIAKFGVASSPTEIRRLLPEADILKSLKAQEALDNFPSELFNRGGNGSDLLFFRENFGIALHDIENYPSPVPAANGEAIDSGMIIREFPDELLNNECTILNLASLMSIKNAQKEHLGQCSLLKKPFALPLIYEFILIAVQKKLVKNTEEFFQTYIINNYLNAIEKLYMEHGISLASHGQNLCLVINKDGTPRGFAYRDMEGVSLVPEEKFLESYALFRHHIVTKLANVLVLHAENIKPQPGAPTQVGFKGPQPERALFKEIAKQANHSKKEYKRCLDLLLKHTIDGITYKKIHTFADDQYKSRLRQYYKLSETKIFRKDGTLVLAESGSENEHLMRKHELELQKHRRITFVKAVPTKAAIEPKQMEFSFFNKPSSLCRVFLYSGSPDSAHLPNVLSFKLLNPNLKNKADTTAKSKTCNTTSKTAALTIQDIKSWMNADGSLVES